MPPPIELTLLAIIGVIILLGLHGLLYPRFVLRNINRLARSIQEFSAEGREIKAQSFSPAPLRDLAETINLALRSLATDRSRSRRREEMLAHYLSDLFEQLQIPLKQHEIEDQVSATDIAHFPHSTSSKDIERVTESLQRTQRLVQDLIDLTKIETNLIELHHDDFFVSELARSLQREYRTEAEQKHITLTVELVPQLPSVHGDGSLVERALSRIVERALRTTPPGGHVAVLFEPTSNGVTVSVRDTGQGSDIIESTHLFDEVYSTKLQGEHGASLQANIGLALSKLILDRHHSPLRVETLPGHGTKVEFELRESHRAG